jgi:hypothetical protein
MADLAVRCGVPQPDRAVDARRGEFVAVGAVRDPGDTEARSDKLGSELVGARHRQDGRTGLDRRREFVGLESHEARKLGIAVARRLRCELAGLRDVALVNGVRALHEGEDGQRDRDGETRAEGADEGVEPPAGGVAAEHDVLALLACRSLAVAGPVGQPQLRGAEVGSPEQVAAVAVVVEPFARSPSEACVLIAPLEIGLECLEQAAHAGVVVVPIAQEDPFRLAEGIGQG